MKIIRFGSIAGISMLFALYLPASAYAGKADASARVEPAPGLHMPGKRLSGEEIVGNYLERQSVDSEFALIGLKRYTGDTLIEETRLILLSGQVNGTRATLFHVVSPPESRGVSLLFENDPSRSCPNVHMYLPEIGQTKQLRARGSEGTPFLGTDFSVEDLMEELPAANLYVRLADAVIDGAECYVVRAKPIATQTESGFSQGYTQRDLYISRSDHTLRRVDFYRDLGSLVKSKHAFGYESPEVLGETKRPHKAIMYAMNKSTSTVATVYQSRLGEKFDLSLLTPEGLGAIDEEKSQSLILGFEDFE